MRLLSITIQHKSGKSEEHNIIIDKISRWVFDEILNRFVIYGLDNSELLKINFIDKKMLNNIKKDFNTKILNPDFNEISFTFMGFE